MAAESEPSRPPKAPFGIRLLAPLRHRPFALLWSGQTISRIGNGVYSTVLAWTVYAISHSTSATGFVIMASAIPQVIFLLAGGLVGDRVSRRAIILVSDSLSGIAAGSVAVIALTGHLTVPLLAVLAVIFGTVSAFFLPAYQAIIPEVISAEQLQTANGLEGLSMSAVSIAGPSIGAAVYAWGRVGAAFGFDALTFLVSASTMLLIRVPGRIVTVKQSIWEDVREGWGYVRGTSWLWVSIVLAAFANAAGTGPIGVLMPAIIDRLHLGIAYLGLTFTIMGLALLAGNVIVAQLPPLRHRGYIMYIMWAMIDLGPVVFGVAPNFLVLAAGAVLLGAGGAADAIWQGLVQEAVPRQYLSRVYSLDLLGSLALRPIGLAASGVIAAYIGPNATMVGGGLLAFAFVVAGLAVPAIRRLD
ncbi:MAG: MFS transporter [Chloroflexota bacterium]